MQLYFKLLKPDGVLAVHISNRYLDLAPVCERGAEFVGKKATVVADDASDNYFRQLHYLGSHYCPGQQCVPEPEFRGREHVSRHSCCHLPWLDGRLQQHSSDPQLELEGQVSSLPPAFRPAGRSFSRPG